MSVTLRLCALLVVLLTACQHRGADPETKTSEQDVESQADAAEQAKPGESLVWANDAFLSAAGVKPGKDVIYLPTPPMVVDKMVELAEIQPTDLVYDLGTGDGRIAIEAARQCGCKVIGYEIDTELIAAARRNVREAGLEHLVTIAEQDILKLDYSEVDVVLMYLDGNLNIRLLPSFAKLKPGARLVSHDWDMGGQIEDDVVIHKFRSEVPDFVNVHQIYLWRAPLKFTNAEKKSVSAP